ncbi:MAG: hypothetical protein AAFX54_17755 [Pseudomonadota bacterium]
MTTAHTRSSKLTVIDTSRLSCDVSNVDLLVHALTPGEDDEHLPCARHNTLEKKALRLTGVLPP